MEDPRGGKRHPAGGYPKGGWWRRSGKPEFVTGLEANRVEDGLVLS